MREGFQHCVIKVDQVSSFSRWLNAQFHSILKTDNFCFVVEIKTPVWGKETGVGVNGYFVKFSHHTVKKAFYEHYLGQTFPNVDLVMECSCFVSSCFVTNLTNNSPLLADQMKKKSVTQYKIIAQMIK